MKQAKKIARLEKAARAASRLESAVRKAQPGCLSFRMIDDIGVIRRQIEEAANIERSAAIVQ